MKRSLLACMTAGLGLMASTAFAQHNNHHHNHDHHHHDHGVSIQGHDHSAHLSTAAPIGVMGDHMHAKGEWMVSYRFMRMYMEGNRDGTDQLTNDEIVTTIANRFAGQAGQPNTLRVVPVDMAMNMHMFGAMYAPTDWLTLMVMGNYIEKDMDHITYMGGAGTNIRGTFETRTSGLGDTKASGLFRLYNDGRHHLHFNAGVSLPTGSIDERDDILTPAGATPNVRLPYAMQLGTGTLDLLPGLTYTGHEGPFGWGAQYMAEIRLGDNDEGYSWGNKHKITSWLSYGWQSNITTSLRISAETESEIDGIDDQIVLPVQTADPDNYGGERLEAGFGVSYQPDISWMRGQSIAAEVTVPVYQDLNGPQMERDYSATVGLKLTF